MRAWHTGSVAGTLILAECHIPAPKADELLVKVQA